MFEIYVSFFVGLCLVNCAMYVTTSDLEICTGDSDLCCSSLKILNGIL